MRCSTVLDDTLVLVGLCRDEPPRATRTRFASIVALGGQSHIELVTSATVGL